MPLIGLLFISSKLNNNVELSISEKSVISTDLDSASASGSNAHVNANVSHSIAVKNTSNHISDNYNIYIKTVALQTSICALLVSIFIFALFDFSSNQFQFVQEHHEINTFNLYLGIDGLSIYFVLLTTIIMPISLLSN